MKYCPEWLYVGKICYKNPASCCLDKLLLIFSYYQFEKIHPFQDGNGRVGRLIMFKECLRNGITPFIIEDDIEQFYYCGLQQWRSEQGYLMDTCLTAQDRFKVYMDYFGLEYRD